MCWQLYHMKRHLKGRLFIIYFHTNCVQDLLINSTFCLTAVCDVMLHLSKYCMNQGAATLFPFISLV